MYMYMYMYVLYIYIHTCFYTYRWWVEGCSVDVGMKIHVATEFWDVLDHLHPVFKYLHKDPLQNLTR